MTLGDVVVLPLHGPSAKRHPLVLRDEIRRLDAGVTMLTEAYGSVDVLEHLAGRRVVLEAGGADRRRGQRDNPIVVSDELTSLGSGQLFGAAASTPRRIAPERWITYSVVRLPGHGPTMDVNLHPHASVQSGATGRLRTGIDRGRQYAAQMRVLDGLLDLAAALGYAVRVGGDVNFRDRGDSTWSPYRVMRSHGLVVHASGIIVLAASKRLGLDVDELHPSSQITDHVALRGRVATR